VKNPSYAVMHSFACKQRAGTAASHKKRARSGRYHAASERRDRGAHTGGCAWPCGVRPKPARQPPRESFALSKACSASRLAHAAMRAGGSVGQGGRAARLAPKVERVPRAARDGLHQALAVGQRGREELAGAHDRAQRFAARLALRTGHAGRACQVARNLLITVHRRAHRARAW